ncbi:MAG: hypothetical protein ACRDDH_09300 [Cetobacterium sp.]|uniref:hypothetical protein n=1 Tax=Cetobacterium sp. TaxID=2071632 RepID=UPI003EE6F529
MEIVRGKINGNPITLEMKEVKGDPPYPAGYYRFDRGQYDLMMPPQGGPINIANMSDKSYYGRDNLNIFRMMSGQFSGQVSMAQFRNSFVLRFVKTEYYKDHRSGQAIGVNGAEVDYSMMAKGGGPVHCMSVALVNTLKSFGFNNMQDLGADGWQQGATRSIDSANVKNNDWQWWDFCPRYGSYYVRFYK